MWFSRLDQNVNSRLPLMLNNKKRRFVQNVKNCIRRFLRVKVSIMFLPADSGREKKVECLIELVGICSKLQPKNVNLTCTYNNQSTDCASELVEGTKVAISCLRGYKPKYAKAYQYIECQDDGEWSNELYECIPGRYLAGILLKLLL